MRIGTGHWGDGESIVAMSLSTQIVSTSVSRGIIFECVADLLVGSYTSGMTDMGPFSHSD